MGRIALFNTRNFLYSYHRESLAFKELGSGTRREEGELLAMSKMDVPRSGLGCGLMKGKGNGVVLVAAGGTHLAPEGLEVLSSAEMIRIGEGASGQWTMMPPLHRARAGFVMWSLRERLMVIGGWPHTTTIEEGDPAEKDGKWEKVEDSCICIKCVQLTERRGPTLTRNPFCFRKGFSFSLGVSVTDSFLTEVKVKDRESCPRSCPVGGEPAMTTSPTLGHSSSGSISTSSSSPPSSSNAIESRFEIEEEIEDGGDEKDDDIAGYDFNAVVDEMNEELERRQEGKGH